MSSPNSLRNPQSENASVPFSRAIAGLVLASGRSTRFEAGNKLLAVVDGVPIVRRTVEAYVNAGLAPVLVVVGYERERVREPLSALPVHLVENPSFELGQSTSLRSGVGALPAGVVAAVVGVGDQPMLTAAIVQDLVRAYRATGAGIVVPRYAGRRGNPVVFDAAYFGELMQVEGDRGGRGLIDRHAEAVVWLDVADDRAGQDIDTRLDFERLIGKSEGRSHAENRDVGT